MNIRQLLPLSLLLAGLAGCGAGADNKQQASSAPAAASKTASAPAAAAPAAQFHGTDIRKDNIGGDFTLTDGNGIPFALSRLKGKVVLLSFGYTHCPDVCPTTLLAYRDAFKILGDQSKDVAGVFVSVDPERDNPELMGKFTKMFHPDFIGLTATGSQDISLIKQQYRIVSAKAQQKSDTVYTVDHTAATYLLDKDGNVVVLEPYGKTAAEMADDVKILLK